MDDVENKLDCFFSLSLSPSLSLSCHARAHKHTHTHTQTHTLRHASSGKVWQGIVRLPSLLANALYKVYKTQNNG
jgi:DNA-binding protein H-NS